MSLCRTVFLIFWTCSSILVWSCIQIRISQCSLVLFKLIIRFTMFLNFEPMNQTLNVTICLKWKLPSSILSYFNFKFNLSFFLFFFFISNRLPYILDSYFLFSFAIIYLLFPFCSALGLKCLSTLVHALGEMFKWFTRCIVLCQIRQSWNIACSQSQDCQLW